MRTPARHIGAERELQDLLPTKFRGVPFSVPEHRIERAMGGEPRLGGHLGQDLDELTAYKVEATSLGSPLGSSALAPSTTTMPKSPMRGDEGSG